MSNRGQENGDRESLYALIGRLSAIITILPSSMAAGWAIGHYIVDRLFGTGPWGAVVLLLIGAGAGFYQIAAILMSRRQGPK
jgi:ATP synthase protein I